MLVGDFNIAASQQDVHPTFKFEQCYSAEEVQLLQEVMQVGWGAAAGWGAAPGGTGGTPWAGTRVPLAKGWLIAPSISGAQPLSLLCHAWALLAGRPLSACMLVPLVTLAAATPPPPVFQCAGLPGRLAAAAPGRKRLLHSLGPQDLGAQVQRGGCGQRWGSRVRPLVCAYTPTHLPLPRCCWGPCRPRRARAAGHQGRAASSMRAARRAAADAPAGRGSPQGFRIDYVLCSRGLLPLVASCEIVSTHEAWSDHAGLLLELRGVPALPKHPPCALSSLCMKRFNDPSQRSIFTAFGRKRPSSAAPAPAAALDAAAAAAGGAAAGLTSTSSAAAVQASGAAAAPGPAPAPASADADAGEGVGASKRQRRQGPSDGSTGAAGRGQQQGGSQAAAGEGCAAEASAAGAQPSSASPTLAAAASGADGTAAAAAGASARGEPAGDGTAAAAEEDAAPTAAAEQRPAAGGAGGSRAAKPAAGNGKGSSGSAKNTKGNKKGRAGAEGQQQQTLKAFFKQAR
jgi:hypothetical protein